MLDSSFDPARLAAEARAAMAFSHSPYSHFRVGAAVLGQNGTIFRGTNVENVSFGLTVCAERTAIFNAVSHGVRDFVAIAVIADLPGPCVPCGACRQVIAEFNKSLPIVMANLRGALQVQTLAELLPGAYGEGEIFEHEPGATQESGTSTSAL